MDDQQLARTLSVLDRPESADPAFLASQYDQLVTELGFRGPSTVPGAATVATLDPIVARTARADRPRAAWLLAAALVGAALIGATVAAAMIPWQDLVRPSVLDEIRREGTMVVLVPEGAPQARSMRGAWGGFDVDIADELARRLGVQAMVIPTTGLLQAPTNPWDLAIDPGPLAADVAGMYETSIPIYHWPIRMVVRDDSTFETIDDLAGAPVCVVSGSSGAAWLSRVEDLHSTTPMTDPPPDTVAVLRPDDDACLDALADETVAAVVTATLDPAGLAVRGGIRAIGGPVLTEGRIAVLDSRAGRVGELLAAVNAAIEAARDDGTLSDLARARFGGHDLSVPPSLTPSEEQP